MFKIGESSNSFKADKFSAFVIDSASGCLNIYIITDMEFDIAVCDADKTIYENAKEMFTRKRGDAFVIFSPSVILNE